MSLHEDFLHGDESHPIDVAETLAHVNAWECDRVAEDQIALSVEGQWRTYALTLAWSAQDETLRLIATFEMEPPEARMAAFYEALNLANDQVWTGAFTYWAEQRLMVWRTGLLLGAGQAVLPEQIDRLIGAAVAAAERFYPAFQLTAWGGRAPEQAMQIALTEAYGRA